ncbi:hypothetical protein DMUE_3808 [Dictyocoela muelleri]|nr:hypothetical protein DMUE_3808 [Dictyocoela muelleri]
MITMCIYFIKILFSYSINIEEILKLDISNAEKYEIISNYNLDFGLKHLINSFESQMGILDRNNHKFENFKGKKIVFNNKNSWEVSILDLENDKKTEFIFYLGYESCILRLNSTEVEEFIEKDIFNDFVIPKKVSLVFKNNDFTNFSKKFEINYGYIQIYKNKSGYVRNIRHIIEFLKASLSIFIINNQHRIFNYNNKYNDNFNRPFPLSNLKLGKLSTLYYDESNIISNTYCFASQIISGYIFYKNFKEKVKNKKIILSENLNNLFFLFDDKNFKDEKELMAGHFFHVIIPDDIFDQNKNEYISLVESFIKIFLNKNGILKRNWDSKDTKYLEILKKGILDKKLSPIWVEKVLGYRDFVRNLNNLSINEEEQEDIFKKMTRDAIKINNMISEIIKKNLLTIGKDKENEFYSLVVQNQCKLIDPRLSLKEYLDLFTFN